ncbi:hypothetical protein HY637_02475 [Candidatus Woesearchaeota archaeon]|nr:hypothetical protein [Candidatus Woesearchaeota archaeon]
MGHLKIVVDHDRIEYNGPFEANNLFRLIENFLWERGFDKKQEKDFEIHSQGEKFVEWQYAPWKKITDYIRYIVKVRILGYHLVKTDLNVNGRKTRTDTGRVVVFIDGYMEYDYDSYWDNHPFLFFLRTIYDYFVFKAYTERFEQRLVHDINTLHDSIEKFFNMHRHYSLVSRPA